MNYMDYTDDKCMYFFSDGQVARANFFMSTDPQLMTIVNSGACTSAWYGEVARLDVSLGNVKTEMGSGRFAEDGLLVAAHVRNPMYYDLSWAPQESKVDLWFNPKQPLCYSRVPLMHMAAPWDSSFFFLGGPGGKSPECKWP